jgi:hypothetical protein
VSARKPLNYRATCVSVLQASVGSSVTVLVKHASQVSSERRLELSNIQHVLLTCLRYAILFARDVEAVGISHVMPWIGFTLNLSNKY